MKRKDMQELLTATLKIIQASKPKDFKNTTGHEMQFLYMLIDHLVTRALSDRIESDDVTDEEQYQHVKGNFENMRRDIKEAIALGFSEAVKRFSNVDVDYVCTIKSIKESSSKLSH